MCQFSVCWACSVFNYLSAPFRKETERERPGLSKDITRTVWTTVAEERRRRKSGADQSGHGRCLAGTLRPSIEHVPAWQLQLSGDLIHMETYEASDRRSARADDEKHEWVLKVAITVVNHVENGATFMWDVCVPVKSVIDRIWSVGGRNQAWLWTVFQHAHIYQKKKSD